jgi:RNA polymerase sigma factor (TIGR02999 family)
MTSSRETPGPGEITRLLQAVRDGDRRAFDRLLPMVYDSLKKISRRQLRRRGSDVELRTTELVHETYLKMAGQDWADWEDRAHFYAVAARAMRQVLVDHARRKGAEKRGGDRRRVTLAGRHLHVRMRPVEILALDEALDALDARSERLRKVVELRFFGGLTEREIAGVLDVSTRTVERDWVKARLFLHRRLHAEPA